MLIKGPYSADSFNAHLYAEANVLKLIHTELKDHMCCSPERSNTVPHFEHNKQVNSIVWMSRLKSPNHMWRLYLKSQWYLVSKCYDWALLIWTAHINRCKSVASHIRCSHSTIGAFIQVLHTFALLIMPTNISQLILFWYDWSTKKQHSQICIYYCDEFFKFVN